MMIFDRLLLGGVKFVLRRVSDAVLAELSDESVLRGRLLEAVERLERGEIGEEEYVEIESVVLDRLRVIREEREGGAQGGAIEFKSGGGASVEASVSFEATPEFQPGPEVQRKPEPDPEPKKKPRRNRR